MNDKWEKEKHGFSLLKVQKITVEYRHTEKLMKYETNILQRDENIGKQQV